MNVSGSSYAIAFYDFNFSAASFSNCIFNVNSSYSSTVSTLFYSDNNAVSGATNYTNIIF